MGDVTGFLKFRRKDSGYRPIEERVHDYNEVENDLPNDERHEQLGRCMDCGVPFCHWACPVSNIMPEWQDYAHKGEWKKAWESLQSTNNFPEITGRVCPAPCEASCVLGLTDQPVTIRENERTIIERAFEEGFIQPQPPQKRTGKKVAVIGSGPAGLAAADLLNRAGHTVTVFEAEERAGGYMRFGIPDFKLKKSVIDRRLALFQEEGIEIRCGVLVGRDITVEQLKSEYHAVCLAVGARQPRDLTVPGRELKGVYFAMQLLKQQNQLVHGEVIPPEELIEIEGKNVLVIGGGDTGSDCVGTSNRRGAKSIRQIELLPQPPAERSEQTPWPLWPNMLRTSSSHKEGCERQWSVLTKEIIGENGVVKKVKCVELSWQGGKMNEVAGTEFELEVDLIFLAMGFVHPVRNGLLTDLGVAYDARGNIQVDGNYQTSVPGFFAAGDATRGPSLVVHAINLGRQAALAIDRYLTAK
ncbi:glutamate synthase subunit beta [Leptonema illini]|uniref:Glutamate synthase (NADH) small subunit n=1 Tax=Leptonema illini DSM 21528 TaxID=929563 RepID=H2CKU5_9LEPT|nr:glutamate synthase subunit beta [Leptonema illini]EHQ06179.1 glutamate synthase (NADH) small subunit [Leptonema illini DSM 21528]